MFEEHPLLITSLYFTTPGHTTVRVSKAYCHWQQRAVNCCIKILCDNLPPDVLGHLCNNKLIVTGTKAIPDDIALGVDVDSMNMSDHVEFDAPQTYMTLQKQWPNVCWKGYHWPEVGHTMTCLVCMSWCKEVWNHLTHSPQVKWPVRMKTIFMRVGSSLSITLLYQFWWFFYMPVSIASSSS